MKKILMVVCLMMIISSMTKAGVLLDDNDDRTGSGSGVHNYNGLNISFKRSVKTINVTFNTPCDNAEVIIYKDGVPVDADNIGSVDAGTTESYSVEGCERGKVSVSVIRDGKELWIDNLNEAE